MKVRRKKLRKNEKVIYERFIKVNSLLLFAPFAIQSLHFFKLLLPTVSIGFFLILEPD